MQSRNFRSVASFQTILNVTGVDAVAGQGGKLGEFLMQFWNRTGRFENSETRFYLSMQSRRDRKRTKCSGLSFPIVMAKPLGDGDGAHSHRAGSLLMHGVISLNL